MLSLGRLEDRVFAARAPTQLLLLRLKVQIPIQVLIEEGLRGLPHRFRELRDVLVVQLTVIRLLVGVEGPFMGRTPQVRAL